jgi:pSer/pThr/pTyr-binding forkhead associated (FHA) protein
MVRLAREWTRVGRSLNADLRLDDTTVSRRHVLIGRRRDGVRLLDDRSLNGVFVNGERVDSTILTDGDEIVIGRYRLMFLSVAARAGSRSLSRSSGAAIDPGRDQIRRRLPYTALNVPAR